MRWLVIDDRKTKPPPSEKPLLELKASFCWRVALELSAISLATLASTAFSGLTCHARADSSPACRLQQIGPLESMHHANVLQLERQIANVLGCVDKVVVLAVAKQVGYV